MADNKAEAKCHKIASDLRCWTEIVCHKITREVLGKRNGNAEIWQLQYYTVFCK